MLQVTGIGTFSSPTVRAVAAALLLVSTAAGLRAAGVPAEDPRDLEWERYYGHDGLRYLATTLGAVGQDGSVWIGGTTIHGSKPDAEGEFWLWKVNAKGEKIKEVLLTDPAGVRKPQLGYRHIRSIAGLDSGDLVAIVEFIPRRPTLIRVDAEGKMVFLRPLPTDSAEAAIDKIITLKDRSLVLVGWGADGGLILKVDSDGNVIWRQITHRDGQSAISDGIALESGRIVVAGHSGFYRLYLGPAEGWLARINERGETELGRKLGGRNVHVARGSDGGLVVAYDRHDLQRPAQGSWVEEVWIEGLTADLEPTWKSRLFADGMGLTGLTGPRIAAFGVADFIVGAARQGRFWLARISRDGRVLWEFLDHETSRRGDAPEAIVGGADSVYVLFSGFPGVSGAGRYPQIGLMRLRAR